ncbi:MAG: ABC transporter substrate-binding protein [Lachnospiraceae bacterium]|nr:ABC transporter substrate-binding protein [Lachnospiraceae bacterium]
MKKKNAKILVLCMAVLLAMCLVLTACGSSEKQPAGSGAQNEESTAASDNSGEGSKSSSGTLKPAPEIAGLTLESTMEKEYATEFDVFYYSDGFKVLSVSDGRQYLLVPEGKEAPAETGDLFILQAPLDHTYLAATSAMALILAIDAGNYVTLTGTNASGWFIPEAAEMVNNGQMVYAGKYSEPDYELLIDSGCNLAIESTMILHTPKVQEMIEKMDIPVFIDRASYESHPLGRTEWVKLYGAMYDKEEAAETMFAEKSQIVKDMENFKNTEKTVAVFNVKTDGTVQIRSPKDYIATMVELGGARYAFRDIATNSDTSSTLNISMEEFYATAVDADYLVYNGTIAEPIKSMDELYALSELFKDFKAVKEGNVWCTGNNMYQATDIVGEFILDINHMVTDGDESSMTFITKVQ